MESKLTFEAYNKALKKNKLMGLTCKDCGAITAPAFWRGARCGAWISRAIGS